MCSRWVIEEAKEGPRMVMTGPWSPLALKAAFDLRIAGLYLNCAKGWKGENLLFLESFARQLKWFKILDRSDLDLSPIHSLHNLEFICIDTFCKGEVDFSSFPHLIECSLEWRPKAKSLFAHKGIRQLYINHYPGVDFELLSGMVLLEEVRLDSPKLKSLKGIEKLKNLRSLDIGLARGLSSIEGVEQLKELQSLSIDSCPKVSDISPIQYLPNLKHLNISTNGKIKSLNPIKGIESLEKVFFCDSTIIADGDLSPLLSLPNLKDYGFANRSHYSHIYPHFSQNPQLVENKKKVPLEKKNGPLKKDTRLEDWFWKIVFQAKKDAGDDMESRPISLKNILVKQKPDEVLEFYKEYYRRLKEAYRWDLWGAAYLMEGGCSDDGFSYWRDFLISEGREVFEGAIKNPDSLASLGRLHEVDLEGYRYAISEAYEELTGKIIPLDILSSSSEFEEGEPIGEEWEEEDLPKLFPKLAELYS